MKNNQLIDYIINLHYLHHVNVYVILANSYIIANINAILLILLGLGG